MLHNPTNPDKNLNKNINGETGNSKDLQNIQPNDTNDIIKNPIDDFDPERLHSKSNEQTQNKNMIEANQTASNSIKNIIPQKQKSQKSSKFDTGPKSSIISARTKKVNSTKITSKNKNNMSTEKRMPKTSSSLGSTAPTAREIFLGSRAPTAREIFLGSRAPTATSLDCRVCKKFFVSVRLVRNHEKAEHADVLFPIKCNICLGGFAAPLK